MFGLIYKFDIYAPRKALGPSKPLWDHYENSLESHLLQWYK